MILEKIKCINKAVKLGLDTKEEDFDALWTEAQQYILNNIRQKRYTTIAGHVNPLNGEQNMGYFLPLYGYNEVQGDLWNPKTRQYEHLDIDIDGTLYLIIGE